MNPGCVISLYAGQIHFTLALDREVVVICWQDGDLGVETEVEGVDVVVADFVLRESDSGTTILERGKMFYTVSFSIIALHLSLHMRKPMICICENKDADQLCSNCTADQRLCFRHMDSTIPLLLISKVSSFQLYAVTV